MIKDSKSVNIILDEWKINVNVNSAVDCQIYRMNIQVYSEGIKRLIFKIVNY